MSRSDIDLDQIREFFDPHPGRAGAAIPIPEPVRLLANELDGKKLSLREVLSKFNGLELVKLRLGEFSIVTKYDYVGLRIQAGPGRPEHFFRVMRYR